MATYISNPAGGNLTASGSWLQVSSTAENDSVATGTAATTAFQYSSTFVPAASAVGGVAVRIYSRSVASVGTVTVYFANNTSAGARESSTTLQIADFPNLQTQNCGWAYFQFPASVTPNGTDAYKIGICTSQYVFTVSGVSVAPLPGNTYTNNGFTFTIQGTSIVAGSGIISASGTGAPSASGNLVRTAGAGDATIAFNPSTTSTGTMSFYSLATTNWSREIVLTAAAVGAPVANDKLLIMGAWTAGITDTLSTTVVTMNSTATTSYGPTVSGGPPDGMSISMGGTLAYGNSTSTNYIMYLKGALAVYAGGSLLITGASGGTFPSTSTALLWFASVANVDSGLMTYNGTATYPVTVTTSGNPLTYDRAFLAADCAASATSLTTNVSTGWLNGDVIALASTTRTIGDCESKALTAGASGTTLTITALSAAHSGTTPTQGELANLTRNVTITGASLTLGGYVNVSATAIVNFSWTAFALLGSATANKRGIDVNTTAGTFVANRCSFYNWTVTGALMYFNPTSVSLTGTVTVTNNVFYNIADYFMYFGVLNTYSWAATITGNLCIKTITTSTYGIGSNISSQLNFPFQNNTIVGCAGTTNGSGIYIATSVILLGVWSGNTVHSCAGYGVVIFAGLSGGSMSNLTTWRNTWGVVFQPPASATMFVLNFTMNNVTAFGNSSGGFYIGTNSNGYTPTWDNCVFDGWNIYSGTTLTQPVGISTTSAMFVETYISNCTLGSPSTHATADCQIGGNYPVQFIFHNTLFNSPTAIQNPTYMGNRSSFVSSQKHNQISGNHKTYKLYGTITSDSTIYYSIATGPSERLTPNNATYTLDSSIRRTSCVTGQSITFSCYIRTSVAGDGTAWNGNICGLYLLANPAMGVITDTLLASASNTPGVWQLLSATTPVSTDDGVWCVVLRVNGTTGFVNTALWSVS